MVDTKKGKVVAALFDDGTGAGQQWFRARIEGRRKSPDAAGLDLFDVLFLDFGNTAAVTVQEMRPLEGGVCVCVCVCVCGWVGLWAVLQGARWNAGLGGGLDEACS
jgi:hypothetical protein